MQNMLDKTYFHLDCVYGDKVLVERTTTTKVL